ncbi:MocR-like pyridoxine biosynthesis transcription factor PdxR [Lacrimispora sp. 210928-DFI.3.58]|uniref:MocR-like pyridoxine biosynthesis transcription factor PdxR n=1 Tax=Lacrimispora sp. 210928-DFI.3.58 TaxID=2883214 RepID=UPI001D0873F1|nr:PLP-dependent aminotransferase family protein [Lacrimispora sp. 210928-DFI.3.58]MCB7318369.1 PLP-dependent aminotransferase family protein [Lacrimispora sp. 210928-DFI.3.58]
MELMVPIDSQSDCPLYEQIYEYIKNDIRKGRLEAGSRLPSTRVLAQNLKVSRSTSQMAYDQLLSEGYIEAFPCRGYFVCKIDELLEVKQKETAVFAQKKEEERSYQVDFSPRGIDLDSFPFNTWRKISRNTLVDDNKEMFAAGDTQGERALRMAIGDYLHSARGVNCSPEQIIIGAGNEYLLLLLSRLLGREMSIAMENPTYKQAYRVFCGQGHKVIPVKMDKYGMELKRLEASRADIAYVMPSHQYPTGIVMPVARRQELLSWAYRGSRRYLIEDDYDSEFRYKGKPIPALQGMDMGGRVIYMGTFSNSIAPAIRVGFMVLPEPLVSLYREKAGFFSSTVSRIDQHILYQFITQGYYERHLNRMRAIYKGKHDALLSGLKELEPFFSMGGEYAGLHVLLTHLKGMTEKQLVEKAAEAGVKVYGMSDYFIDTKENKSSSTVLLGYANLSEKDIDRGCRLLKKAWLQQ